MFSVITSHPVAAESIDHLHPHGTKQDNHGDPEFIQELAAYFKRPFALLDMGCAGGQWVVDALSAGNRAAGLEGSDYNVRQRQFNWPEYHNRHLFTADIGKPFVILEDQKLVRFDVITMWEVLEHIEPADLPQMLLNIENHLAPGGVFVGTINCTDFVSEGHHYHRTVMSRRRWQKLFNRRFDVIKYPFRHYLRHDCVDIGHSFLVSFTHQARG